MVISRKAVIQIAGVLGLVTFWAVAGSSAASPHTSNGTARAAKSGATKANIVTSAKATVAKAYGTGLTQLPPKTGPAAVRGKTVWYISCGQQFEACANMSNSFKGAGKALGWNVSLHDGKADPNVAASVIQQAVAAGVDGIALTGFDCPAMKGALLAAKQADIPVAVYSGFDCNNPVYGGTEDPLFTANVKIFGDGTLTKYFTIWGKVRADYIIAKTNGKATIINIHELTSPALRTTHAAFTARMKKCGGCKLIDAGFSFATLGNAIQKFKSTMVAHPEATVISFDVDSLMGLGLASAIAESRRKFKVIAGADGTRFNSQLIRQGKQTNSVARADAQHLWGLADTLNRIFAGQKALPNEGGGMQIIDKTHNLPRPGSSFQSAINFQALYKKIWNK